MVAEEPHVVVLPIQGEVLTAFSVDQLLYNETLDDWRTHDGVDTPRRKAMPSWPPAPGRSPPSPTIP